MSTLNERLERKESELTECKRKYDQDYEIWRSKVRFAAWLLLLERACFGYSQCIIFVDLCADVGL